MDLFPFAELCMGLAPSLPPSPGWQHNLKAESGGEEWTSF